MIESKQEMLARIQELEEEIGRLKKPKLKAKVSKFFLFTNQLPVPHAVWAYSFYIYVFHKV